MNSQRSLKDSLLEYAVLNIDLLIPHQESYQLWINANSIAQVPPFPNHLFEEILDKSKDMCWPINDIHLKRCFAVRSMLKWSETSCFRHVGYYSLKDLKLFPGTMHNLKTLKALVNLEHQKDANCFNEISKAADTLEDLDLCITIPNNFLTETNIYSDDFKDNIVACTPLKLKRLVLHVNKFENFPYIVDPGVLTVFNIAHCILTKFFLKSLVGFKRLTKLSLCHFLFDDVNFGEVIDAVATLKSLHCLVLVCFYISTGVNEVMLNRITKGLENLNILELDLIALDEPKNLITPRRKLKVLNYWSLSSKHEATSLVLAGLAQRIGHFETFQGLMTIISSTLCEITYKVAIKNLFKLLDNGNINREMLIEAETAGITIFRDPKMISEAFYSRLCSSSSYHVLLRMTCYACRCGASSPYAEEFINNFVSHNENTHLAKRLHKSGIRGS